MAEKTWNENEINLFQFLVPRQKKVVHVLIVPFPALSRTQLKHQRLLQLMHDTRASLYLVNLVFI